jgi:nucleotide-binding universal stress UspA family protein
MDSLGADDGPSTGWKGILVPVRGGSDATARASLAVRLAEATGAALIFLYVVDERPLGDAPGGPAGERLRTQLLLEGEAVLHTIARLAEEVGVGFVTRIEIGPLVETIVRAARETGADVIVVGAHRQTWLGRLLGGSVAEAVLRAAPCAVLAVPPAAGAAAGPVAQSAGAEGRQGDGDRPGTRALTR